MIKKMGAKTIAILLSAAMVFTMMPLTGIGVQTASAATSVPGGTISVDTTNAAEQSAINAFNLPSSNVTSSGDTLTINLASDVILEQPVRFVLGTASKKVILNLNNHSITGRAGVSGTDLNSAIGGNAIEIATAAFDVEIKGPGSVIGGKGAVYQNGGGIRQGQWGGNAIFFVNDESNASYAPSKLNHGLKVSGGARLIGGAGSDVTFDDWVQNISTGTEDINFLIEAGRGGDAISQEFTDIGYETTLNEQIFAKINVENGTVSGGVGGNVLIGDSHPLTYTYISGLQPVKDMISRNPDYGTGYFNGWFFNRIRFSQGNGGSGIQAAAGRKYISVGQGSTVSGGDGGYIDYGNKGKFVNKVNNYWNSNFYSSDLLEYNQGAGGTGISIWGDLGLTNTSPSLNDSNWNRKTENSDDIGVYIAGSVEGGNAHSAIAINDFALEGGDAIKIHTGEYSYCEPYEYDLWNNEVGILYVGSTGKVTGGNGGDSIHSNESKGSAGEGGAGIFENESSIDPGAAADYYLIEGTVTGGDGGDSGTGSYGFAGNAVKFKKKYQRNKVIAGSGTLKAGNYGSTQYSDEYEGKVDSNNRILDDGNLIFKTAVDGLGNSDIDYIGSITRNDGGCAYVRRDSLNGFKASVVMTPLNGQPTANTTLECNVIRPSGYSGDIYYKWCAHVGGRINTMLDIEGAESKIQKFNLLSYSDYNSIQMEESYGGPSYNIKVMTHESLYAHIRYNDSSPVTIWCEAVLDDGRMVKSNVLRLTKSTQEGNGDSGGEEQGDDQEAVNTVLGLIDRIPSLSSITLEDEEAVIAAREAYETLTESQKELMSQYYPSALSDLEAAERKIRELKGDEVNDILADIEALCDPDELSLENWTLVEDEANAIREIREKVKALTPEQQAMLASDENAAALAKFEAVDQKIYELVHGVTGSDYHDHLMQCVPEKAATCSTEGNSKYYRCMTCHELYGDQYGGNHITDANSVITAIVPDAHVWDGGVVTKQPAVGVAGTRTYTCTLCDATRTETIAALPQPQVAPAAPAEIMDLPAVKISKPKAAKKKLTAKWKKVNKKNLNKIGRIEIQVMGPGVDKTVTAGKKSKSKKIGGLQSKQKYSVRVRAYKWIGSTKHVSKWSGWKTVKVK